MAVVKHAVYLTRSELLHVENLMQQAHQRAIAQVEDARINGNVIYFHNRDAYAKKLRGICYELAEALERATVSEPVPGAEN